MTGRLRDDSGVVAVIVAVFSVVMFALASLVVDLGIARETKREAQAAADAAALAGAGELYADDGVTVRAQAAIDTVKAYVADNFGTSESDWSTCSATLEGSWTSSAGGAASGTSCIAFDDPAQPKHLRIVVPSKRTPALFGGLMGYDGSQVAARAEASVDETARAPDCVFCVLGPWPDTTQNGDVGATGGNVWFNGNVDVSSNGHVTSDASILVEGSVTSPGNFSPAAQVGAAHLDDPLAGMPLPVIPASHQIKTQPCGTSASNGPGIYFTVTGSTPACTLQPGLYVIAAPVDAIVAVNATAGVTLFFACKSGSTITPCSASTPPSDRGSLAVSDSLTIKAPTSGPTKGLALVYDRGNVSQLVPGHQRLTVTGTIYGRNVTMSASGSDCATQNSLIVVRAVTLNGNGSCLRTRYVAAENVPERMGPDGVSLSR